MMRSLTLIFFLIFAIPLQAFQFTALEGPYYLSVGPEMYYSLRNKEGGSKQSGFLYGAHFTFERRAPCKFYWGLDGYIARGTMWGHTGSGAKLKSTLTDTQFEGTLGYTFHKRMNHCLSFTPFVGYGYF